MLHGREARLPTDLVYGPPPDEGTCASDFVSWQQETLREAFQLACKELDKATQRRKRHYDMRVRPASFPMRPRVWYLVPRHRQDTYPKWQSPIRGYIRGPRAARTRYEQNRTGRPSKTLGCPRRQIEISHISRQSVTPGPRPRGGKLRAGCLTT